MIHKRVLTLTMMLAATALCAAPSVLRHSGDCRVQVGDAFDEQKAFKVAFTNSDVEVTCEFRADDDFFGDFVVIANPSINNKSGKVLKVSYSVAFLDKAGELVGCASQSGDVSADATDYQFASCLIHVPPGQLAKITSYKVVSYVEESQKEAD